MMRLFAIFLGLVFSMLVSHAQERKIIESNLIRLYIRDDILRQRIGNVSQLATYIKSLEKEVAAFWGKTNAPQAKGLFIAVGVKPQEKVKVWCETVDGEIQADTLVNLRKRLSEVVPLTVKQGPIAFALEIKFSGQNPQKFPEMPKTWIEAAKKSREPRMIPDGLFKIVWPD